MRKRTRRIVALVILVTLVSSLADLTKALIAVPLIEALLIDWDSWNFKEGMKNQ